MWQEAGAVILRCADFATGTALWGSVVFSVL